MSYRRLPNTDKSRVQAIRALINCINYGDLVELEYHHKEINFWDEKFCKIISKREDLKGNRTTLNANKKRLVDNLSLYLSHYIQVLNFAIIRGDLDKSCRELYCLDVDMGVLPQINNTNILKWANNIINGENERVKKGGEAISFPNIKTIEKLRNELREELNTINKINTDYEELQNKIVVKREKVDLFIKDIWDKIEQQFISETLTNKRKKATQFGVVYVE